MSTQVEGAAPPMILLTAKATLAAGRACLMLTVVEESGDLWRYGSPFAGTLPSQVKIMASMSEPENVMQTR